MKNLKLTMLGGVAFASGMAQANFQCTDFGNEISMKVNMNHVTHLGDTSVSLTSASGITHLFGTIHTDGGSLLNKKVIKFYPFQGDTLTIVSRPKSCGRGSCDFDAPVSVSASLKIGETKTFFTCNEINH